MFRKFLESKFLKGKMTYAGIAGFALPMIGKALGVDIAESDWATVIQAIGIVVATMGRIRAAHQE